MCVPGSQSVANRRCRRSSPTPLSPTHALLSPLPQSFLVGPRFKGVKMLPPGPHLVSYNASSGQGDFGPTTSFWVVLKAGQVAVQRWDAAAEVLAPLADEDEVRLWRGLERAGWQCCWAQQWRARVSGGRRLRRARPTRAARRAPPSTPLPASAGLQAERYAAAVRSFQMDQHLAPYDLSSYNRWRSLSSHVRRAARSQPALALVLACLHAAMPAPRL